jgi:hypothetical protein
MDEELDYPKIPAKEDYHSRLPLRSPAFCQRAILQNTVDLSRNCQCGNQGAKILIEGLEVSRRTQSIMEDILL